MISISIFLQIIVAKYFKGGAKWGAPGEVDSCPPKDPNFIRVSFAGDSITDIGPGSFPIFLEEMVKGKKYAGKEIEIANFGRSGSCCSPAHEENKDYQQYMVT